MKQGYPRDQYTKYFVTKKQIKERRREIAAGNKAYERTNTVMVCKHCGEARDHYLTKLRRDFMECHTCGKCSTYESKAKHEKT